MTPGSSVTAPAPLGRSGTAVCLLALVIASCAVRGPTFGFRPDREALDRIDREYAPYRQRGDGAILGRAWIDTPDGRRVFAALRPVRLTPVTTLSREFVDEAMQTNDWTTSVLTKERAVVWRTRTDEEGFFDFNMLPEGEYYLICAVAWTDGAGTEQETVLVTRTLLGAKQELEIVLAGEISP